MNREQYLAKRMRVCGTPPDGGSMAVCFDAYGYAGTAPTPAFPPAVSLVDHYRSFHPCISRAAGEDKPN